MATGKKNSGAKGLDGLKDMANRLTPVQKVLIGAAVLTVAVGGFMLRSSAPPADMSPLFTDLAASDAQSVLDQLDSRGVDHKLTDSGKTIMVPTDQVYTLRVALSAAGLPASNEGYALMDKQGITTSEFMQRVDYQRALEGELSKTLRAMDGVSNATVHLALPDDTLFVDQPSATTASVMIDTGSMDSLGADAVQAVVHLVAASVKNLDPANVTVVDAKGTVLSGSGAESTSGTATARAKAEQQYEQDMTASLTAMLAKVAGNEHVTVNVKASLDLSQRTSTSETWGKSDPADPTGATKLPGVVSSETTSSEKYVGTGAAASTGVLGPDGSTVAATPGSANDTYDKADSSRQYNIDRTVQQTVEAPGAVTALHVAVMVDEAVITPAQVQALTDSVAAAAGLDTTRGDTLVVSRVPFVLPTVDTTAATAAAKAEATAQSKSQMYSLIRTGALAFVALIAILLAWSSARRARRVVVTPMELPALEAGDYGMDDAYDAGEVVSTPMHDLGLPSGLDADRYEYTVEPAHAPLPVTAPAAPPEYQEVVDLAAQNPVEVANVIRSWLSADLEAAR